jgi:hypothetical protein
MSRTGTTPRVVLETVRRRGRSAARLVQRTLRGWSRSLPRRPTSNAGKVTAALPHGARGAHEGVSDLSERTAVNGNGTRRLDEKSRSTATQRATNAGLEG